MRQKKKYDLAKVNYVTVDHKDYLAPFDFKNAPKSHLPGPVNNLLEEVANITMYKQAMTNMGIDQSVLPISNISKDVIAKAKVILD